jgi:PEP-CTERM motif-containing protein
VQVVKTVHVASGMFAALPLVDQHFFFVPEPLTLVLLTLGLGGLALWGRRHGALAPANRS